MGLLLRLRIALGAGSGAGEESSNSSKGTVDDVEFSVLNGIKVNASTTHGDQHIPIVFREKLATLLLEGEACELLLLH